MIGVGAVLLDLACDAGVTENTKAKDTAMAALNSAKTALETHSLFDLVQLEMEGVKVQARDASSTDAGRRYQLNDCVNDWSCCSCQKAGQLQLYPHHVLALMRIYANVPIKDFGDTLVQCAGRKFGEKAFCQRGVGDMLPLSLNLINARNTVTQETQLHSCPVQPHAQALVSRTQLDAVQASLAAQHQLPPTHAPPIHRSEQHSQELACVENAPPASPVPATQPLKLTPSKRSWEAGGTDIQDDFNACLGNWLHPGVQICPGGQHMPVYSVVYRLRSSSLNTERALMHSKLRPLRASHAGQAMSTSQTIRLRGVRMLLRLPGTARLSMLQERRPRWQRCYRSDSGLNCSQLKRRRNRTSRRSFAPLVRAVARWWGTILGADNRCKDGSDT